MRRIIALILALLLSSVFTMTGCFKEKNNNDDIENNDITMSEEAQELLEYYEINNSTIESIDFDKIEEFAFNRKSADNSVLSDNIRNFIELEYEEIEKPVQKIEDGDSVIIDCSVTDKDKNTVYEDKNIMVVLGCGLFDSMVEAKLVGMEKDDSFEISTNDLDNYLLSEYEDMLAEFKVIKVVTHKIKGDGAKEKLDRLGLNTFEKLYEYIYDMRKDDLAYESYLVQSANLFKNIKKSCDFKLDSNEIRTFSDKLNADTKPEIDTGDGKAYFLPLEVYPHQNIGDTLGELKLLLACGALAGKYDIKIDENEFNEYCSEYGIGEDDVKNQMLAKLYFLKESVKSFFESRETEA